MTSILYIHGLNSSPASRTAQQLLAAMQRIGLQAQLRMLKSQKSRRNEATGMKCTFMHKRTPVAELELDDVTGFIQKIGSVYAPEHLPIGIPVRNEIADRAAFNDWWRDRSIPASRSGVREALESLGVADTKMLLVRCYGLSLSDQYWICPEGAELRCKFEGRLHGGPFALVKSGSRQLVRSMSRIHVTY